MFGVDMFGYTNQLFNADAELPIEGPSFQSISTGSAIKENLGSGGRWGESGKSFTLLDAGISNFSHIFFDECGPIP